MAAEGSLEIVAAERQEEVAQGVHGRSPPNAGAKGGVQAVALDSDEGDDLLVRGRTRQNRENREQQQMAHAVALSLGTARIADRGERSKQGAKRHHGDFPEVGDAASTDPFLIVPPLTFGHGRLRPPQQNCMALHLTEAESEAPNPRLSMNRGACLIDLRNKIEAVVGLSSAVVNVPLGQRYLLARLLLV